MRNNIEGKCKKCGSDNIMMVEYDYTSPEYYDGVSEINCKDCGACFGRWSGKELAEGEIEKELTLRKSGNSG